MIRFVSIAVALAALSPAASAQTPAVNTARAAGIVGERFDGYLGLAGAGSASVRAQVSDINIRRRALYTSLSTTRRVTVSEVGIAAGCQLLSRVGVGHAYMLADGVWRRRQPGESPPVPEYCG